ncbi:tRNA dihydrouridine synthase DusB [Oceanicaulis sp. AH-315-P02]|nr:tRNA dihydrouridine synthase DusB [Oceanicaulis sp. AH-315-P02]
MTIQIQNIILDNPVVLAPMSGISDLPFRKLVRRLGAGLVVSEMTASELLVAGRKDMVRKIANDAGSEPFVVQLAGREAKWMAQGAKLAADAGAQIIDINMGCPARKVTKGASGSALMRDLDHALTLIEAVISAVEIPVTLKMRLGWDHLSLNAPELAKRAEEAGVSMICVHGRTRCQFYQGVADWSMVRQVKEVISVPLLVNGDICSTKDAVSALGLSGADGVMIGRAACGRPWLPGLIADELAGRVGRVPTLEQQLGYLLEQFTGSLELYGPIAGVKMFRKHIAWTIDAAFGDATNLEVKSLRSKLCRKSDAMEIREMLSDLFYGKRELSKT